MHFHFFENIFPCAQSPMMGILAEHSTTLKIFNFQNISLHSCTLHGHCLTIHPSKCQICCIYHSGEALSLHIYCTRLLPSNFLGTFSLFDLPRPRALYPINPFPHQASMQEQRFAKCYLQASNISAPLLEFPNWKIPILGSDWEWQARPFCILRGEILYENEIHVKRSTKCNHKKQPGLTFFSNPLTWYNSFLIQIIHHTPFAKKINFLFGNSCQN